MKLVHIPLVCLRRHTFSPILFSMSTATLFGTVVVLFPLCASFWVVFIAMSSSSWVFSSDVSNCYLSHQLLISCIRLFILEVLFWTLYVSLVSLNFWVKYSCNTVLMSWWFWVGLISWFPFNYGLLSCFFAYLLLTFTRLNFYLNV
jgi:hypothetical protein